MSINYEGRVFSLKENSPNGQVYPGTRFYYHQRGNVVWATYGGGTIAFGTLIATAGDNGKLDMRYQHVTSGGEIMTGQCESTPETLPDGRLRMHEKWRWTSGDKSEGTSMIEEVGTREME